jgi:hypothetical protein
LDTAVFSYRGWAITLEQGHWHGRREGEHQTAPTYLELLAALAQTPLLTRHYLYLLAIGKTFVMADDAADNAARSNVLPFQTRPEETSR